MKKQVITSVRGRTSEWCITWDASQEQIDDMRADGLEVHELRNSVPAWAVDFGLTRVWCFAQDVFNFRNPFAK